MIGKDTSPDVGKNTQFKPGQSGNPLGKPKGYKHISTWIQELLNEEDFETILLDSVKGTVNFKGAPIKAIVMTARQRAAQGDDKAREWLAKYGYGQKLQLSNDPENPITPNFDPVLNAEFAEFLKQKHG